jgi:hypothetical protein
MKYIELGNTQGHPFSLTQVKKNFITKFWLPHSEQYSLSELRGDKKRDGELLGNITKDLRMK